MSIITVQIGQCGNQIGEKLFETIISDCFDTISPNRLKNSSYNSKSNEKYVTESKTRFFTENATEPELKLSDSKEEIWYPRAVLIDMENKVVSKLVNKSNNQNKSTPQWLFREANSYTQKKGSGNNWFEFFYNQSLTY